MQPWTILLAGSLLLGACQAALPGKPPAAGASCDAGAHAALIGRNLAAVTLPAGMDTRIIRPGDLVTQDYKPGRLNLHLDADGVIEMVNCG